MITRQVYCPKCGKGKDSWECLFEGQTEILVSWCGDCQLYMMPREFAQEGELVKDL